MIEIVYFSYNHLKTKTRKYPIDSYQQSHVFRYIESNLKKNNILFTSFTLFFVSTIPKNRHKQNKREKKKANKL
jgi:hypothetical protein